MADDGKDKPPPPIIEERFLARDLARFVLDPRNNSFLRGLDGSRLHGAGVGWRQPIARRQRRFSPLLRQSRKNGFDREVARAIVAAYRIEMATIARMTELFDEKMTPPRAAMARSLPRGNSGETFLLLLGDHARAKARARKQTETSALRRAVLDLFLAGVSCPEIGRLLGISARRVRQLIPHAGRGKCLGE